MIQPQYSVTISISVTSRVNEPSASILGWGGISDIELNVERNYMIDSLWRVEIDENWESRSISRGFSDIPGYAQEFYITVIIEGNEASVEGKTSILKHGLGSYRSNTPIRMPPLSSGEYAVIISLYMIGDDEPKDETVRILSLS